MNYLSIFTSSSLYLIQSFQIVSKITSISDEFFLCPSPNWFVTFLRILRRENPISRKSNIIWGSFKVSIPIRPRRNWNQILFNSLWIETCNSVTEWNRVNDRSRRFFRVAVCSLHRDRPARCDRERLIKFEPSEHSQLKGNFLHSWHGHQLSSYFFPLSAHNVLPPNHVSLNYFVHL